MFGAIPPWAPERGEKAKFAKLLGACDVFDDHARQDDELLAVIRNMKPVWEPGAYCFRWTAVDPNLSAKLQFEHQAEERVVVFRGDDSDLDEGFEDKSFSTISK